MTIEEIIVITEEYKFLDSKRNELEQLAKVLANNNKAKIHFENPIKPEPTSNLSANDIMGGPFGNSPIPSLIEMMKGDSWGANTDNSKGFIEFEIDSVFALKMVGIIHDYITARIKKLESQLQTIEA